MTPTHMSTVHDACACDWQFVSELLAADVLMDF